jgi:hypothetical protein
MTETLKEALWWTLVFVVIAVVIAAGIRVVDWITGGSGGSGVWKAALVLIGASAGGGKAVTAIRHRQDNTKGDE